MMALSIILRNSAKINGLSNLAKISSTTLNNAAKYTNVAVRFNRNSNLLVDRCAGTQASKFSGIFKRYFSVSNPLRSTVDVRGHSHAMMWSLERILAGALIFIVPATFVMCNPVMDNIFAITIAAHSHWGIEAICVDYIRPIIFGNIFPKIALLIVYCLSASVFGGLLYYNYNDIGIGATFNKLWKVHSKNYKSPIAPAEVKKEAEKATPKKK